MTSRVPDGWYCDCCSLQVARGQLPGLEKDSRFLRIYVLKFEDRTQKYDQKHGSS